MFNTANYAVDAKTENFPLAVAQILSSSFRGKLIEINGFRNTDVRKAMKIYIYSGLIVRIVEVNGSNDHFTIYYLAEKETGQITIHKNELPDILNKLSE